MIHIRFTFVDQFTVRMTGRAIPHGEARKNGLPLSSNYEARKKDKSKRKAYMDWSKEYMSIGKSNEEVKGIAEATSNAVKIKESEVKKIKKALTDLECKQSSAAYQHRMLQRKPEKTDSDKSMERSAYNDLRQARKVVRELRSEFLPQETQLRQLRQSLYYWNKVSKAPKANPQEGPSTVDTGQREKKSAPSMTTPTWSHYRVEDSTEMLDISAIVGPNSRGNSRQVVFAGTDYGIVKMSETCALSQAEITRHINRYQVLSGECHNLF